jgi:hypothetical protein
VVGAGAITDERLQMARGFDDDSWAAAKARLAARGLLDDAGTLTDAGSALRADIERRTDELSFQPYVDGLTEPGLDLLPSLLSPLSRTVAAAGIIPFPNPIGLSPPA